MAEILGTAAAALQLAGYCSSLWSALNSIRCASRTVRKYRQQLEELERLCYSIRANPLLWSEKIDTQIISIISSVANYIDNKLGKWRALYYFKYIVERTEFAEFFRLLEADKSTLLLSISSISASLLYEIRADLHLIRTMNKLGKKTETMNSEQSLVSFSEHQEPSASARGCDPAQDEQRLTFLHEGTPPSISDSGYQSDFETSRSAESSEQYSRPQLEEAEHTAEVSYFGQVHTGDGVQLNGPEVNEKPDEPLVKLTKNSVYEKNVKKPGRGKGCISGASKNAQINGPDFARGKYAQPYAGRQDINSKMRS